MDLDGSVFVKTLLQMFLHTTNSKNVVLCRAVARALIGGAYSYIRVMPD